MQGEQSEKQDSQKEETNREREKVSTTPLKVYRIEFIEIFLMNSINNYIY